MEFNQLEETPMNKIEAEIYKEGNETNDISTQEESPQNPPLTLNEINEKMKTLIELVEIFQKEKSDLVNRVASLESDNKDLKEENAEITTKITAVESDNKALKTRVFIVEKKMWELESLIIRNNINVDLLANRDSLKTIVLIISFNLGVTKIKDIKTISKNLTYNKKFTKLLLAVLEQLNILLHPAQLPWRKGAKDEQSQSLNESEKANTSGEKDKPNLNKEKIIKKIIFVECIHFIVCYIDNIVHPPEESNKNIINDTDSDIYSKLINQRTQETLKRGLIQFFENPKTIEELTEFMQKSKEKKKEECELKIEEGKKENKICEEKLVTKEEDKKAKNDGKIDTKNDQAKIMEGMSKNENKNLEEQDIDIKERKTENKESKEIQENKEQKKTNGEETMKERYKDSSEQDTKTQKKDKKISLKIGEEANEENANNITKENEEIKRTNILRNDNGCVGRESTIYFENYDKPKNLAYLQNKNYYEKLNRKNDYINQFFIQYLFDPGEEEYSGLKTNYQEFLENINEELTEFNNLETEVKPLELIQKLKWLS